MRVLAFDCSTSVGSVAVCAFGETLFVERFACPRGRGGEFFPVLERAVRAAGWFDRVAVGIGPGSYNGLRAAIAAAEGLHIARGVERVGIASPRALSAEREYFACGDARSGRFWLARIFDGSLVGECELVTVEELRAKFAEREDLPRLTTTPTADFPELTAATPDAELLARLAGMEEPTAAGIEPLYLKPAHITQPRARQ